MIKIIMFNSINIKKYNENALKIDKKMKQWFCQR